MTHDSRLTTPDSRLVRRNTMDEYSSLAGTSIITPPHGRVSGLTGKRKIGDRKKQKKNGKEKEKKEEGDVIIHERIRGPTEKMRSANEGRHEVKDGDSKQDEEVVEYGKRLQKRKRKSRIDLMI